MNKKICNLLCIILTVSFVQPVLANTNPLARYKPFDEVFQESIGTDINHIKYGMICFPGLSVNSATSLEAEDLKELLDAYQGTSGKRMILPMNDQNYLSDTGPEDVIKNDPYFYIGVSAKLPDDRWTWYSTVNMAQLCFGGEQSGDVIYGGFGRKKSEYGDDFPGEPMPSTFIRYRPQGEEGKKIREVAMKLYDKYKEKAKPFGDYEGTGDEKYFSGCDETFSTKFRLPYCLSTEGCSEWAVESVRLAAINDFLPYELTQNYTGAITRADFCKLIAQTLSVVQYPIGTEIFDDPETYPGLLERMREKGLTEKIDTIYYHDVAKTASDIQYLSVLGIVNGIDNNDFDPDHTITREEIAVILGRVISSYSDVLRENELQSEAAPKEYRDDADISDWAKQDVYQMRRHKIITGMEDNRFSPQGNCTTEQAIAIVYRLYNEKF